MNRGFIMMSSGANPIEPSRGTGLIFKLTFRINHRIYCVKAKYRKLPRATSLLRKLICLRGVDP